MSRWLLARIALLPLLLLAVSAGTFLLSELVPGDPVDFMIGENATSERKSELRAAYHLDDPLGERFVRFYAELLSGELRSLHTRRPVIEILAERLPNTGRLALAALLVSALVAIPLGTLAARKRGTWIDDSSMLVALVGISVPSFWLGPMLIIVFAIGLGWFPVSGADAPGSIVLPALTLGLGMASILTRITRASVLETLGQDYIRAARARGLSERTVVVRHALRTAAIPIVTVLGLQLGALLTGTVITEEIFAWPGVGREIVQAVRSRDLPMVQGSVLLLATIWAVVNTLTDVAYAILDPRVALR
ncbi:MAG: ABC transporter permease [Deltaproteobacteria bacterium]|nr:ABC transporter permease [Deltaproteobacteria bacterium]